jgi:hypothetical protein
MDKNRKLLHEEKWLVSEKGMSAKVKSMLCLATKQRSNIIEKDYMKSAPLFKVWQWKIESYNSK